MVERKSWEEFKSSGFLWWINRILHTFGWAIVYAVEEDGTIKGVYPARVKFRGFYEEDEAEGFKKVSDYMVENANEIREETYESE